MKGGAASSPATTDSGYGLVTIAQEISKRENQVRSLKTKQKSDGDESGSLRKEIRRVIRELHDLEDVQRGEKKRVAYESAGDLAYDYSDLTMDERLIFEQNLFNLQEKHGADALALGIDATAAAGTPWAPDDARRVAVSAQHTMKRLRAREAQTHAVRASDIIKETSLVVSLAALDQEFGGNIEIYIKLSTMPAPLGYWRD